LVAATSVKLITARELAAHAGAKSCELARGILVSPVPGPYRSGVIAGAVAVRIARFVDAYLLGESGIRHSGFHLASDPDTVRCPDVWFLRADRLPSPEALDHYYQGAPDLAVGVLSPSDRFREVADKVRDYLLAGTRLVWVLDPATQTTLVFRADGTYTWVDGDGALDGEDVLPGFSLPLRDVFK
jgi:Uma2 family endonuclease